MEQGEGEFVGSFSVGDKEIEVRRKQDAAIIWVCLDDWTTWHKFSLTPQQTQELARLLVGSTNEQK